jgi:hypothetical protein
MCCSSGPVKACNGIALPLPLFTLLHVMRLLQKGGLNVGLMDKGMFATLIEDRTPAIHIQHAIILNYISPSGG